MSTPVYAACVAYAAGLTAVGIGLGLARDEAAGQWATTIGPRLAERILSDLPVVRSGGIEQTHHIATFHPDVDLSATVPALIQVYRTDPVARYRLAAVATLHAMGSDQGLRSVRAHLDIQTDRYVQIISIAAIRDHFGRSSLFDSKEIAEMTQEILKGMGDRNTDRGRRPDLPPSLPS